MNSRSLTILFIYLFFASCSNPANTSGSDDPGNGSGDPSFSYSQKERTGSSASDLLSSDPFSALVVEIDFMEGFEPRPGTISNLQDFLEAYLSKPGGILIQSSQIPAMGQTSYNTSELLNIEDEHRDEFARPDTLTAYLLITDAPYDNESVVGLAYLNTSMSVSGETVQNNSGGLGQPSQTTLETTVMNHEFGHILGLVNIGSDMVEDHEDSENPAHCTTDSCLMYWAVETTDFIGNLSGGNIPALDSFCVQDLNANKN